MFRQTTTITDRFNGSSPYERMAWRRYQRLSDDQRAEIRRGYARHARACKNIGIETDPTWLVDAIEDMRSGR